MSNSSCERCKSDRILSVSGKCCDSCFATFNGKEQDGYVPGGVGIGGGDYVEIEVCLECGQLQGNWPIRDPEFNR